MASLRNANRFIQSFKTRDKVIVIPDNHPLIDKCEKRCKDKIFRRSGYYLHGDIVDLADYDLCTLINPKGSFDMLTNKQGGLEGIIQCDVLIKGSFRSCIGYFWTNLWCDNRIQQRGLICLSTDKKAIEDADQKMKRKDVEL